jgi:serine/threonine-protein kinase
VTAGNDNADEQAPTAAAENDATSIVPAPTEAAPELAWSQDDGDADNAQPWHEAQRRAPIIVFIAALAAFAIAVVGWFSVRPQHNQHVASLPSTMAAAALPPISTTPPAPTGPVLDGAYQLTFDIGAARYRGKAAPPKRSGVATIWWAFRSSCTPVACTASAVKLDDTDHTVRSAKNITDTFTYVDGKWVDAPISHPDNTAPGCTNVEDQWTRTPQPDGTLAGVGTVTLEGSCGSAGNTTVNPFTATRIGPVPANVL